MEKLDALLNPGKIAPPQREAAWAKVAEEAMEDAREILKREWEVTKYSWLKLGRWFKVIGLSFCAVGVAFLLIWQPPQLSSQRDIPVSPTGSTANTTTKATTQDKSDTSSLETHYSLMSEVGLGLILLGFLCQLGAALKSKS